MGLYTEYINKQLTFEQVTKERKAQLQRISQLRGREIIVYASDSSKSNAPVSILPQDFMPFKDQLSFIKSNSELDIIIETPGGIAETVEDIVHVLRAKFDRLGIIIPGSAKSAGTIFAMAGDEILMGNSSALGPIDAQIVSNGKRFSADAFLDGLEKIKKEIAKTGKLNPAYIPMLQNISPGEIQHFENAQSFSQSLVTKWLSEYKFKYWEKHSSTGNIVTKEEKEKRAKEIAKALCKHSDWLTHGRSIRIGDLESLRLLITNYSKNKELEDAIDRYFTLLRLTFDITGIYKIFETISSQIYQSANQQIAPAMKQASSGVAPAQANADINCPKCGKRHKIQLNLAKNVKIEKGSIRYPENDIFACESCGTQTNLLTLRMQLEAQTGMKVVLKG